MSWRAQALCRHVPTDVFYPATAGHRDNGPYLAAITRAANICGRCPVSAECGQHADRHQERWGIWAGRDRTTGWRADGKRRKAS